MIDINRFPDKISLNEFAEEIHQNAVEHGWWEKDIPLPTIIALCHSELSEALEEYRNNMPDFYLGEGNKPEGIAVELIDCMIRILDFLSHTGVDIEKLMMLIHGHNKGRPYKHGRKRC